MTIFQGLYSLKELWLYTNQIAEIQIGTFNNLDTLQILGLSGNRLTSLPPRVFDGLSALVKMELQWNSIKTWSPGL